MTVYAVLPEARGLPPLLLRLSLGRSLAAQACIPKSGSARAGKYMKEVLDIRLQASGVGALREAPIRKPRAEKLTARVAMPEACRQAKPETALLGVALLPPQAHPGGGAAVDVEDLAGHEVGRVRDEKGHRRGHVLWVAHAAPGDQCIAEVGRVVRHIEVAGTSMMPGPTAFTRTLRSVSSMASWRVKALIAPLVAA